MKRNYSSKIFKILISLDSVLLTCIFFLFLNSKGKGKGKVKRAAKDKKFGFGGKKSGAKKNNMKKNDSPGPGKSKSSRPIKNGRKQGGNKAKAGGRNKRK